MCVKVSAGRQDQDESEGLVSCSNDSSSVVSTASWTYSTVYQPTPAYIRLYSKACRSKGLFLQEHVVAYYACCLSSPQLWSSYGSYASYKLIYCMLNLVLTGFTGCTGQLLRNVLSLKWEIIEEQLLSNKALHSIEMIKNHIIVFLASTSSDFSVTCGANLQPVSKLNGTPKLM